MEGLARWARSRRGALSLAVALLVTGGWTTAGTPAGSVVVIFGISLVGALVAVSAGERVWERNTWPDTPAFARPRTTGASTRMLREDANGALLHDRRGFLFAPRTFFVATGLPPVRLSDDTVDSLGEGEDPSPVLLADDGRRRWWAVGGAFYWENAGYSPRDVHALVAKRERRHERELERAHLMLDLEHDPSPRREAIPRDVRQAVFERDAGQCVECGSIFDLQYDHVIPLALGGGTRTENLQLLCGACNREKSANL